MLARLGVEMVEHRLRQFLSGRRIDTVQHDAAVHVRRASGGHVKCVVLDHDRAVDRPGRFELSIRTDESILGSGAKSPDELAVRGIQTVDPSVGGSEKDRSVVDRRRTVDPPTGSELPDHAALIVVGQGVDGMGIDRGHEDLSSGNYRLREFATDRLDKKNESYRKHYKTLIDTPAVQVEAVTLYKLALNALYEVLKQDFSRIETMPLKRESDFLGSVGLEIEIEDRASPQG